MEWKNYPDQDSWEDHAELMQDGLEDMIEIYDDKHNLLHNMKF